MNNNNGNVFLFLKECLEQYKQPIPTHERVRLAIEVSDLLIKEDVLQFLENLQEKNENIKIAFYRSTKYDGTCFICCNKYEKGDAVFHFTGKKHKLKICHEQCISESDLNDFKEKTDKITMNSYLKFKRENQSDYDLKYETKKQFHMETQILELLKTEKVNVSEISKKLNHDRKKIIEILALLYNKRYVTFSKGAKNSKVYEIMADGEKAIEIRKGK